MKKIFIIVSLLFVSMVMNAQSPFAGIWQGTLDEDKFDFLVVFRISEDGSKLKGTMDIPQQLIVDYKSIKIKGENDSLTVDLAAFKATYKAVRKSDSLLGIWYQSGQETPLNMALTTEDKAFRMNRPQTPQPPYPYICKDVTFVNKKAKIKLAGTLTIPDTTNVWPVVVLVSGSGPQDRNEELLKHQPFLIIADYFTRNGIAVLRYDDRGVGKSEGKFNEATTADLSSDAGSAVSFLKTLPYIDKKAIGMLGHSEGGVIVLMQASQNKSLRFVISMAGVSIPCLQLLVMQNDKIMEGYGAEEDIRDFFWNFNTALYNLVLTETNNDTLRSKSVKLFEESAATLSDEQKKEYGLTDTYVNAMLMQLTTPWFKYFLSIIPSNYIKKIRTNVLAINGSKDVQVPADANIEAFNTYFVQQPGIYKETHVFPGLNHVFQPCTTGMTSEYAMIETTIDPQVLEYMTAWIKKVLAAGKK
ncbi:X-Pro dipeptidyl-peptidase [anaerobic digester metagenome]